MLTTAQTELIQNSFATAISSRDDLVTDFYHALFAKAPSVRGMFADDISSQSEMLTATLQLAVAEIRNLEALIEPLRVLGAKHAEYGAEPAHYAAVSEVLVESLQGAVGPTWTPEHTQAWTAALTAIAQTMLDGAAAADQ